MGKGFGDGQEHAIFYDTYTDQKIKYHFKTSAMTVKDITHEQVPDELSFAQLGLGLVFFLRDCFRELFNRKRMRQLDLFGLDWSFETRDLFRSILHRQKLIENNYLFR